MMTLLVRTAIHLKARGQDKTRLGVSSENHHLTADTAGLSMQWLSGEEGARCFISEGGKPTPGGRKGGRAHTHK